MPFEERCKDMEFRPRAATLTAFLAAARARVIGNRQLETADIFEGILHLLLEKGRQRPIVHAESAARPMARHTMPANLLYAA